MTKYSPCSKAFIASQISKIASIFFLIFFLFSSGKLSAQNCSVNAGIPQTVCANQKLFLQGSFTPPIKSGVQVLWTQIGGPAATIVDPTNLGTEIINILAGNTYSFRIYTTCADGALTYQDVTHTVKAISIASAGPDATYCPATYSLAANAPGSGETGLWTGGGNGISINTANSSTSTITISGGASGPATLRWTITNTLNGCSSYDEVVITNRGGLSVNAGTDQTLSHCYSSTQSTSLSGSYAGSGLNGQIGTWSVVSGPNVPTIANPNSANTSISNLITGTYVFRWTVVGPCVSGSDEVSVIVPAPTANITSAGVSGGNQVFCDSNTSSTVLYGTTPLYINETVQWIQTAGPVVTIVSPTSPITSITGLVSPNTYTFSYTINNGTTTCSSSASVVVSYLPNAPTLNITTASPILLTCGTNSTTIAFNQGGSGSTQYRFLSGPGSGYPSPWTNSGGSPLTISGLTDVGTYVVQMRRSSTVGSAPACGTVYDEISIVTSVSSDAANAGTDQILNCNVTSTDLIGNVPAVGLGTWSQVSGPSAIILTSPHSPTLSIAGLLPNGLYVFRWLISGGPICTPSQDDVQVYTAGTSPVLANAGSDQSNICYNTPVYMNATPPSFIFERGTWSVTPSAGVVFSDTHSAKAIVTGLTANTIYTFTWTVANGCGTVTDNTTISVINSQGPIVSAAGTNQCLNSGVTSITLSGNSPTPGTGLWTQISGTTTGTITSATSSNTTVAGLSNGTYQFEWAISSGGCSPTRDTVMVTIDTPIQTFNAGADQQICGNTATLTTSLGANPTTGSGKWTQVSGNASIIANPNNYTTTITGLVAGTCVYRYTITNGGCSASDEVTLFVSEPASPANIPLSSVGVCGASTVNLVADVITSGTGLWTIVSGPNTPIIVSAASATTTVNGMITGSYIFRWTVTGGSFCTATSDDISVTVTLNANAGSDQSYCEAITTINLIGTAASIGNWSQVSGPGTANITATSSSTATASGLIPGVYTFEYSISASGCTSTDVMTVTLYTPPSIANAGIDQEQCNQSIFNLTATNPASGTGTWSKLSGPTGGAFGNVNSPTSTFTGAAPGVYVFQWTVSNGSCSNADQVRISNYAAPTTANAGSTQTLTCATTATMAGNNPVNGLGTWTFVSKAGDGPTPTITNPILYNTTITGLGPQSVGTPETYSFRWTIANGAVCSPTQDDVTVTVYQLPTAANAGDDQTLCNQTSVVLGATPVGTGTGTWSVTPSAGITFPDIHSATATANGLVGGATYVFRWTSATAFCNSADDVTVVNSAPPTVADVSSTVTSYCSLVPIILRGITPVNGTGLWTQISGDPLVVLSPTSPNTSAIGGTIGHSYGFQWTISSGNCARSSATVTVTMNTTPTIALAGPDQELCASGPTTSTVISGNALGGGGETGLWSIVTNAGGSPTFADATTPTTTINGLVGGNPNIYELQWAHAQGICTATDNMIIKVWAAPTTSAAGSDQTWCNVNTFTLAGNTPAVGSGVWTRVSGPNNPTITNPSSPTTTITGVTSGTYVFRWTISNGICSSSTDDVTIVNRPAISLTGPSNASICVGGSQTLTVTASGGSGLYNYQWQYYNSGWTNVGNSSSFSTGALGAAGSYAYRVIVTDQVVADNGGCINTSGTATITVVADPTINTQPINPTDICQGGSTGNITISASGGTPSLTYQWQYWNGSTWNNVVNGTPTGATYSNPTSSTLFQIRTISLAGAYQYRCLVSATGNDCNQAISNLITLTVVPDPAITVQPVPTTICSGTSTDISVTATGGTPSLNYLWESSANGSSGWSTVGTNSSTLSTGILSTPLYYKVTVSSSGAGCNSVTSNVVKVTVPYITSQPIGNVASCEGSSYSMTIAVDFGTASPTYQWQYTDFDCISGWSDIVGAASSTYTATAAALPLVGGTRNFRCVVSINGSPTCSPALTSNCAPVTVSGCNPKIGLAKQLVSMDNNGDGTYEALFNLRVQNYGGIQLDNIQVADNLNTTFGAGNYTVLGISSTNFAVNTAFNGNTNQNLLVTSGNSLAKNASSDIRLRVKILSAESYNNTATASSSTGGVTDVSQNGSDPDPDHDGDVAEHSVVTPVVTACSPVITVNVNDGAMCHDNINFSQTYPLTATASNASSYTWTTDGTGTFTNGTTLTPTYTPSASDVQDGQVRLKIIAKSGGVCPNVEDEMILTIWTPPTVNAPDATTCATSSYAITGVTATNYSGLAWTTNGTGTFNSANTLNPTYSPSSADLTAGGVTLTITANRNPAANNTCSNVSDAMRLTFLPVPTVNAGSDVDICATTSLVNLTGSSANATTYLWSTSGTGTFGNATLLTTTYTPGAADKLTAQVQLTLTATGTCGTVSNIKVLNIWPTPLVDAGPSTTSICSGSTYILTGATAANYATVSWTATSGTFNNANALNPTFTPAGAGTATLTITATSIGGLCSTVSDNIVLTINAKPTLTATVSNATCGASNGSVILTSGDGSTITLNGVTQSSATTFNGLSAGLYTATSNGTCQATVSFNISNANSTLTGSVMAHSDVSCNGGNTGSITVTANGGTAPYSYVLIHGATNLAGTGTFNNLVAGEYAVRITDTNNCTYTVSFDIEEPSLLILSKTSQKNVTCQSLSDGSVTVQAVGGTTGYGYSIVTQPSGGTAVISANVISGMKAGNYTLRVTDANLCTADLTVTITQTTCNPVATDDFRTTPEDSPVSGNVLTNDTDPNGLALTITQYTIGGTVYAVGTTTSIPGVGSIVVSINGDYTFTPVANFNGPVPIISYTITNGTSTDTANINITITPLNDNPQANPDVASVTEDTTLNGNLGSNDTLSGDGGNVWSVVTGPTNGSVIINIDGTYTYTPNANFYGTETITYRLCDVDGSCSTSTIIISVTPVNDPPVARPDIATTPEDTPISGNVLTNDSDTEINTLTVTQFQVNGSSTPTTAGNTATITNVGTITIGSTGTFTFIPVANYNGPVPTVTYTLTDGTATSTANLDITVTPVDDFPVAVNDGTYTTNEDIPYSGTVVTKDIPSGDGSNVWSLETNPAHGTVVVKLDGTFTYTPAPNYNGSDSFTYKLCDADNDCSVATVTFTVSSVNDKPVAVDDNVSTPEETPLKVYVVVNDNFGGDGPSSSAITIAAPSINGTATVNDNGTPTDPTDDYIDYTPYANYQGNDSFVYQICDANGDCTTATVVVNVNSVNDLPIARTDTGTVTEDTTLNGNLGSNDTLSGDGGNVWSVVTGPTNGSVIINIDGTDTYTPNANFNGTETITYQLCDTNGDCSTSTLTITVTPVNDRPVIADVPKTGIEDSDITFVPADFTSKFTDIDGNSLTQIQVINLPANGTLKLNGVSVIARAVISTANLVNLTFTPNTNWNGSTSFDWNGYDGTAYAAIPEQVNLTITPVNDLPLAGTATMPSQLNPGGTNSISVFANNFSGTDPNDPTGFIASIKITTMPSNATSITVDGVKYNSIPVGGIPVTTNATGQPLFNISIDPFDGAVTSVLSYQVVDNGGATSTNTGTVTIPFDGLSIVGTVFNDANGLTDNTVNGTPTNAGSALFMNLVNTLNQVVASKAVAANGSYTFAETDGLTVNTSYKLIVTSGAQATGTTLSTASYPAGVVSSGENIGSGSGNDGTINGILAVNTNSGSLANANFGISGAMTLSAGPNAAICSSAGSYTLNGSAANANSILWSTNGTGTFNNPTLLNASYTPSEADIATGEVQLTITATGIGSVPSLSDMMVLTIWPSAIAYAGIDMSICRGDVYQILDANVRHYTSLLWTHNGLGILSGETTLTPVYQPGNGEIGTITLTLTATLNGSGTCSNAIDSKALTITDPPTVVLGADINNCALNVTTLTAVATNYSRLEWTTSGTGTFSSANSLTTTYTPSVADINYAQVTLRLTAKGNGTCTSASDELVLKLWRNTYDYAGNDVAVCNSEPIQVLDAEAIDYVALLWTHNGTGILINETRLTPTYKPGPGETGQVTLTLHVTPEGNGTCPELTDQKIITIGGAPSVSCPVGGTFNYSNTPGKCGYVVPDTSLDATGTGCNGKVTVTHNYSAWGNPKSLAGATFPVGVTTVIWTAKDSFGNSSSCSISIRVQDQEAPNFVNCSSGTTFTIGLSPDVCETGAIWSRPVAVDNCTPVVRLVQTKGPAQGSRLTVGTYEIEYTAIDDAGNSMPCSFFVKVIDTERPVVVCREDFEVQADKGNCSWASPTGSLYPLLVRSNCAGRVTWEIINPDGSKKTGQDDASGYVFQKGVSTVNYVNKEIASGQVWNCSFKVTVVDREAPVVICSGPIVQTAGSKGCDANITLNAPAFFDNCGGSAFKTSYTVVNPDNSETGVLTATSYTFKAGISRVIWTLTDASGNSGTCVQQVTINADPSVIHPNAGANAVICEGSTYSLTGSATNYSSVQWTTEGSGLFSNAASFVSVYTPSQADIINGNVVLKLTASTACASSTATMTLTINRNSVVRAGTAKDSYICEGSSYLLNGAAQTNATGILWTTSGTGSFANATELNTTYTPGKADIAAGSVVLIISGQSASPCGKSTDALILHLVHQVTANAGTDATICEGSAFTLASSVSANSAALLWKTSGTGVFSDPKALHPTYFPSASDIVNGIVYLTLTATSEYPCNGTQDELVLTIARTPKANAGIDFEACSGDLVKIVTASAQNFTSTKWTTDGKGTLTGENTLLPTYKPASGEKGKLKFILTATGASACNTLIAKDTVLITYHEDLHIDMMAPETILYNTSATLNVSANQGTGNYIYRWEPSNLVPNFTSNRTQTLLLTENTLFTVTITDVHTGCVATENVLVTVEKEVDKLLEFYNGLTPNGDGNNDVWWIDGIEKFPDNEVLIFNRWGDKIIELKNYDNIKVVWDGKNSRGNQMPDGTYYYVAKIKNVKAYTGWINLRSGQ